MPHKPVSSTLSSLTIFETPDWSNAFSATSALGLGIFTPLIKIHFSKARSPMLIIFSENERFLNLTQPENASFPIFVTFSGIFICVNDEQFLNV